MNQGQREPPQGSKKEAGATSVLYQDLDGTRPSVRGEAWRPKQIEAEIRRVGQDGGENPTSAGSLTGQGLGLGGAQATPSFRDHLTPIRTRGHQPGLCYLHLWPHLHWAGIEPGCRVHSRRRAGGRPHLLGAVPTGATRARPASCSSSFHQSNPQGLVQGLLQRPYSLALPPWELPCSKWGHEDCPRQPGTERVLRKWQLLLLLLSSRLLVWEASERPTSELCTLSRSHPGVVKNSQDASVGLSHPAHPS